MTVDVSKVGWGTYLNYEGSFFKGSSKYIEPASPTWTDKVLSVITSSEGGFWNAINCYDRMVISVGIVQYGEAGMYGVSDLLGLIAERGLPCIHEMDAALKVSNAVFKKNAQGKWRFFFLDSRGEVNTLQEQQQLFLLHSNGTKGTWDDASRAHVKMWAAAVASVLEGPEAIQAQRDYITPRLMTFLFGDSKTTLFGSGTPAENEGWAGAVRAGYISFAANLPVLAAQQLAIAVKKCQAVPFSEEWCIAVLKQLTFGPGITIYPNRYNMIRPTLERLFRVNLPDFAADLKTWTMTLDPSEVTSQPRTPGTVPSFTTVKSIQEELIAQGFDLGPAGADGVMGPKTREAILYFQQIHKLTVDGQVGPKTRMALADESAKRHKDTATIGS